MSSADARVGCVRRLPYWIGYIAATIGGAVLARIIGASPLGTALIIIGSSAAYVLVVLVIVAYSRKPDRGDR